MTDLERVFRFAFDGSSRFPGYINPVVHRVTGPFRIGETLDHAAAGAARAHHGQRISLRARRATEIFRLPERLQGGAG